MVTVTISFADVGVAMVDKRRRMSADVDVDGRRSHILRAWFGNA
jgi:hypothetical protein